MKNPFLIQPFKKGYHVPILFHSSKIPIPLMRSEMHIYPLLRPQHFGFPLLMEQLQIEVYASFQKMGIC